MRQVLLLLFLFFPCVKCCSIQKNKKSILIRVLFQIRSFSLQNWQMRRFELLATRPRSCSRHNGRLFGLPDSSVIAAVNFALCVEDTTPVALLELQFRIDVDLDLEGVATLAYRVRVRGRRAHKQSECLADKPH